MSSSLLQGTGHVSPPTPSPCNEVFCLLTAPVYVLALGLDPQAGPMRDRMFQNAIPLSCFQDWPIFARFYPSDYHLLEDTAREMVPTLAPGTSPGPSDLTFLGEQTSALIKSILNPPPLTPCIVV